MDNSILEVIQNGAPHNSTAPRTIHMVGVFNSPNDTLTGRTGHWVASDGNYGVISNTAGRRTLKVRDVSNSNNPNDCGPENFALA